MTSLLTDRTGISFVRLRSHVKIANPRHTHHGQTGTVVRLDRERRRVWVAMPGGVVTSASSRSVEVL